MRIFLNIKLTVLIISMAIVIMGCVSFGVPSMATFTKDGKSVELTVEKKKPEDLMVIDRVALSPDRKGVLVIGIDGAQIFLDSMKGIVNDLQRTNSLAERKEGFSDRSSVQNVLITPDEKYMAVEGHGSFGGFLTITDRHSGKSFVIKSGISRQQGSYYFGNNDILAVHFFYGTNDLEFYDLKVSKKIKSYSIPYSEVFMKTYANSMSSDANRDILVFHQCRFIQFYRFATGEIIGNLLFFDKKNWVLVSVTGEYDGTPEAIKSMAWHVGESKIGLADFGENFYKKGLLADILGISTEKHEDASINIAGQLVGKVNQVSDKEIIIALGRSDEPLKMGDRLFILVDGKRVIIEVTFPMMTLSKCIIKGKKNDASVKIRVGMPVFR